jgi:hypothetical protein
MTFFIGPNRWESDGAKSGMYGGRRKAVRLTSLSDAIFKTNYSNDFPRDLMKLCCLGREISKLVYTKFKLFTSFRQAEIKNGTKLFE